MALSGGLLVAPAVQDARLIRGADAGLLGLALMDARTRTLGWLAVFEGLQLSGQLSRLDPPIWLIGRAAWYQEYWIARHVQRGRGQAADPAGLRLASLHLQADAWFGLDSGSRADRWAAQLPEGQALRDYLQDTLEATLELLDKAAPGDEGLLFFRQALHHEDLVGEQLAVLAQTLDLSAQRCAQAESQGLTQAFASVQGRPPIGLPGQHITLGGLTGGWVPDEERGQLEVAVAEFEIDAQPVTWAEFVEFIDDGGYDDRRWWRDAGWDWLEASNRRAPRHVAQLSGGVLVQRHGRLQRVPSAQPVLHVSAHEADAWCNWAGRRLPSEAEWQLAATTAAARGWAWGEVLEWVAGSARAYPGGPAPVAGAQRVLRGATRQASPRLRHPAARRLVPADADEGFCGFRSCTL
jgi:ergothioneine biosynthesis protein EgtB